MHRPPSPDEVSIDVPLPPVSQQARAESKAHFQAEVKNAVATYGFLLSGDVSVAVEWSISQRTRYETDRSPDVDNILKPLIDALVGPAGLMIDDNQVQHVSCHWIDSYDEEESIAVRLRFSPDEWFQKDGLLFVQLEGGLCVPVPGGTPIEFQIQIVDAYTTALRLRSEMLQAGLGYYDANVCMPVQRVASLRSIFDPRA
jgi:Holliday junction resolvase RusA-like endonuclease